MAVKLKTRSAEVYFNPQTISRLHLSPDHKTATVHFINGTVFSAPVETDEERRITADLFAELSREGSGFLSSGRELLNLAAALWISFPEDGPVQIRWLDNRTHSLFDADVDSVRTVLEKASGPYLRESGQG